MKTINIYLNKEERQKIEKLKVKYQLSLTTILDILCEYTMISLKYENNETLLNDFTTRHLYAQEGKTSIKEPRNLYKLEIKNKSAYLNNVLHTWLNKDIGRYIKHVDLITGKYGYYNSIEKELNKRTDAWWNYNQQARMLKRFLKQNPKERQL